MIKNDSQTPLCTCPSGNGSLRHPCPAHPAVEQAGGDERDFQAEGAQEVPSPVSQEYDRHLISLLRKGEALPGHQEEAADEIERLRDWNDHLNNTVLPNILNPTFLMLMKGGERLLDLCTKDGEFIGVSLNDMKDVFDWMVTHARIAPDQAALAQPSPAIATAPTYQFHSREIGESDWAPCDFSWYLYCSKSPEMDARVVEVTAQPSPAQAEQAEAERPEVFGLERYRVERTGQGFWPYCVRAGDGTRELFVGHLKQCKRVAAQLATAFEDGKFVAGALRAENAKLIEALDESDGDRWRLRSERDAALARVAALESKLAELEKQEPVAWMDPRSPEMHATISNEVKKHNMRIGNAPASAVNGYSVPLYAQAQHSVPDGLRELLEMLVVSDLRKIRYAGAWRREVHNRASSILALLAAAPGKEGNDD